MSKTIINDSIKILVDLKSDFSKLSFDLQAQSLVVDIETTGLDFNQDQICGIGVSPLDSKNIYYFPILSTIDQDVLSIDKLSWLIERLNKTSILIGHNIKFDLHFLEKQGLKVSNKELIDTIVMARLTEPARFARLGLEELVKENYDDDYKLDFEELRKKNRKWKMFSDIPIDILSKYCMNDVYYTKRLFIDRKDQIEKTGQFDVWKKQIELTKVLLAMEDRGIDVDTSYAKRAQSLINQRRKILDERIFSAFKSDPFNLNSSQQIGKAFNNLKIKSKVATKKGAEAWNEGALLQINHSIAGYLRERRTLERISDNYLNTIVEKKTSRLHTKYKNWGTVTGRFASDDPNMQNIPRYITLITDPVFTNKDDLEKHRQKIEMYIRSKAQFRGANVSSEVASAWNFSDSTDFDEASDNQIYLKRLFIPRAGYSFVSFDYSQMEMRVFMSYLRDPVLNTLMRQGKFDYHAYVAETAFGIEQGHPEFAFYRQMAKAINFGIIYGIGIRGLSGQLNLSTNEAKDYRDLYFSRLPKAKSFIRSVTQKAMLQGFVHNRYGRRYWIEKGREYVAVNYLVQGTSADILSYAMVEIDKLLYGTGNCMVLQIHDELICEIKNEDINSLTPKICNILIENLLGIPLIIDAVIHEKSWAFKRKLEVE